MSEDAVQNYRLKLGPAVSEYLSKLPEQTPAALDAAFIALLGDRERLAKAEARSAEQDRLLGTLSDHNAKMAEALAATSTSVSKLTEMVDHRTKVMITIFLQISGLVGSKFAVGTDLEHIHRRFTELTGDLEVQIEKLVGQVREQKQKREAKVIQATSRAEEERLTLAERTAETAVPEIPQPRRGGMER
mgnify:FL=1